MEILISDIAVEAKVKTFLHIVWGAFPYAKNLLMFYCSLFPVPYSLARSAITKMTQNILKHKKAKAPVSYTHLTLPTIA